MTPPLAISQQAQSAMAGTGPVVASSIVSPDRFVTTPSAYTRLGVFYARLMWVGFCTAFGALASLAGPRWPVLALDP